MSALSTFLRRRTRPIEQRELTVENLPPVLFNSGVAPPDVGVRQSVQVGDILACVRVLTNGAIQCPLQVFETDPLGLGQRRVIDSSAALLLRRPNPTATQPTFVGELIAALALWGEAFVGKYKNPDGSIFQLRPLAPDTVDVEVFANEPRFKYYRPNAEPIEGLGRDDVIHIRGFSLDGIRGASPIKLARETVSLAKSLTDSGASMWANGGRPGAIVTVKEGPGAKDAADTITKTFADSHQGPTNAGRLLVQTGEVEWKPVTVNMTDAEYVESRKLSTADIARLMGVPPSLVNAPSNDSLTYSTVQDEGRHFVTYSLGPWLRLISEALNTDTDLFPNPNTTATFNTDALMKADPKVRFEGYEAGIKAGVLTPNECRAEENLPALDTPPPTPAPQEAVAA